jgi:hypothetical protein
MPLEVAMFSILSKVRVDNGKDYVGSDTRMIWMAGWKEGIYIRTDLTRLSLLVDNWKDFTQLPYCCLLL